VIDVAKKETAVEMKREVPYHKISVERQIDILKGFATLYEKKKRATYKDVAPLINMNATDVSACLKFWKSVDLLEEDNSGYRASNAVCDFVKKIDWNPEEAWSIFSRQLKDAWFVEHVGLAFQIKKSLSEEELVNSLGSASGMTKRDAAAVRSLRAIIKLLELTKKIIKGESGNYTLNLESSTDQKIEPIEIPEDKDMIKAKIGEETFAVSIKELIEFVRKQGKRLSEKEIKLK
jgi:hypothetical protein